MPSTRSVFEFWTVLHAYDQGELINYWRYWRDVYDSFEHRSRVFLIAGSFHYGLILLLCSLLVKKEKTLVIEHYNNRPDLVRALPRPIGFRVFHTQSSNAETLKTTIVHFDDAR